MQPLTPSSEVAIQRLASIFVISPPGWLPVQLHRPAVPTCQAVAVAA
jgi:hypothetical protein